MASFLSLVSTLYIGKERGERVPAPVVLCICTVLYTQIQAVEQQKINADKQRDINHEEEKIVVFLRGIAYLHDSKRKRKKFWCFCLKMRVFVKNQTPRKNKTAYEAWLLYRMR
jgi:hypothetical protein